MAAPELNWTKPKSDSGRVLFPFPQQGASAIHSAEDSFADGAVEVTAYVSPFVSSVIVTVNCAPDPRCPTPVVWPAYFTSAVIKSPG